MIPIFLSSDNNYAPYLAVTIKSICENTKSNIIFYILDCGIEGTSKTKIIEMVSQYKDTAIEFINPAEQNIFSECRVRNHLSSAAYVRLLIPQLKPQIDKAIYLDVDIIVNLDIAELYAQNINGHVIGSPFGECAVYHNYGILTKKTLGIDLEHNYFCSGVLLIDCKKWRENNITQKLKDIYDEYKDRMVHNDQDLLNILFSINKYSSLDTKFNYIIQYSPTKNPNVIYHYDGPTKPWHFPPNMKTNVIKYIDIWWDYAKRTPFYEELQKGYKYNTPEVVYELKLSILLWKYQNVKKKIAFIKKFFNKRSFKQSNKEQKIHYLNLFANSLLCSYTNNKTSKFKRFYDYIRIFLFVKYLKRNISQDILKSSNYYKELTRIVNLIRKIFSIENIRKGDVKHKVFTIFGIKLKIRVKNDKSNCNNTGI